MKKTLMAAGMLCAASLAVSGIFAAEINPLEATEWELTSFEGKALTGATVKFGTGKVFGSFCNNLSTTYSLSGDQILAGPMATTLMYCNTPLMDAESKFDLSNAKYQLMTGNQLELTTASGSKYLWAKKTTPAVGTANPASVNCEKNGGKHEIVKDKNGNESGVCTLSDGAKCDEWAYYRGECPAKATTQEQKIHKILDDHFAKHADKFPTAKEKTAVIEMLKTTFTNLMKEVNATLKAQYQEMVTILGNYKVK